MAQSVTALKGVGPKVAEKLARLGLRSVQDVLFHLPFRYQDRSHTAPIGSLAPGREVVITGRIELTEIAYGRRRSLLSRISDGTGSLTLRFFHFSAAQQANLRRGRWIRCFGTARPGRGTLEMIHPEYEVFDEEPDFAPAPYLTPVYSTTEGLHQLSLRRLTGEALAHHLDSLQEWLPDTVRAELELPSLREAVSYVHAPPADATTEELAAGRHPAQQRLAFEELLAHHLSLRRLRARRQPDSAPAMDGPGELSAAFLAGLPFQLTGAQARVLAEIQADLAGGMPMQRLIQGDVGSGKTVVAAAAALQAVAAGYQVAVMAPTEILAEQHMQNFTSWLAPLDVTVTWLAGKLTAAARRRVLASVAAGEAQVVVGTHALFQETVKFAHLGFVIIDEQHRFGVHQRLSLREKGRHDGREPHQLIMTATPIPRTLAMTFYADLDLSTIDELPPGRTPVETIVLAEGRRSDVLQRVSAACQEGRQAYWVCPLIEESESLQAQAATETEAALREAFSELAIGLVHGRMKSADKENVMRRFKADEIKLLVATTVIEVGVDVPNASLMVIENSERLGLSQLHQLRGRVGRGAQCSTCVLMYHPPLSETAHTRLATMRETNDGFAIARKDLELRGPGELLGTRQTGDQLFRIADLVRDQKLLPRVEKAAGILLQAFPDRVESIIRRWLGAREHYGDV